MEHRQRRRLVNAAAILVLAASSASCVPGHLAGDPGWSTAVVNESAQTWLVRQYRTGGSDVLVVPPETAATGLDGSGEFDGLLQVLRPDCTVVMSFPEFKGFDKATIRIDKTGSVSLDQSEPVTEDVLVDTSDCAEPAPS